MSFIEKPHGAFLQRMRQLDPLYGMSSANPEAWAKICTFMYQTGRVTAVEDLAGLLASYRPISSHDLGDLLVAKLDELGDDQGEWDFISFDLAAATASRTAAASA